LTIVGYRYIVRRTLQIPTKRISHSLLPRSNSCLLYPLLPSTEIPDQSAFVALQLQAEATAGQRTLLSALPGSRRHLPGCENFQRWI